jgi:hypothetical protein
MPKNIVEITRVLLGAGAEVDATSQAYGRASTDLGLAATSYHPAKAEVQLELLQELLNDAVTGPNGSPPQVLYRFSVMLTYRNAALISP